MAVTDVVVCFYRQARFAPFFAWGVRENRESIGRVIVVNDEPWREPDRLQVQEALDGIPSLFLEHPHAGPETHGVSRCFNQGIARSEAEYVLLTSFDQVLQPGSVADLLDNAAPGRMVIGRVDGIAESTRLEDLPDPEILRPDFQTKSIPEMIAQNGTSFSIFGWRNGHNLVHAQSHTDIGGFDERFVQWGYGLEDQDYCIRWLLRHGLGSIWWSTAASWHFVDAVPSVQIPRKADWNPDAIARINEQLRELYRTYQVPVEDRKFFARSPDA